MRRAAVLAAQVPVLAGAYVVQKRLVALVDDQAYVGDARVDVVGQHEVDQTVASAKGQRAGVAGTGQFT